VLGYFAGRYLAGPLGLGAVWVPVGVLSGFFLGLVTVVLLIRRFMEDNRDE